MFSNINHLSAIIDVLLKNGSCYKFLEKAIRIFLKFTRIDGDIMSFFIAFFIILVLFVPSLCPSCFNYFLIFDKKNKMLQLSEIWIYPIKSLAGIPLSTSKVLPSGLEHDRRWMLVDQEGVFISQRETPQLALFYPSIEGGFMSIKHADESKGSVKFSLSQKVNSALVEVTVWDDVVAASEVSPEVSAWFTEILGFPVRLVYMPQESLRAVDLNYTISNTDSTAFSDGFPFLIIGQSSLEDLNSRMENPITIKRFRPNFVFTGGKPYDEETWKEFRIGGLLFYGVKPSGRCIVINVDPEKGKVSGKDPLLTLSKYKKVGEKVIFGQNLITKQEGVLHVGATIST